MNIKLPSWLSGSRKALPQGAIPSVRPVPQSPHMAALSDFTAREVSPYLYEAIREGIPVVDAAIDRLVTLDGILAVETESDVLRHAIEDWMDNVLVNDFQNGLQTFYAGQGAEMYEQGHTMGTFHLAANDVDRLRVLDSKGTYFQRAASGALEAWYAPPGQKRNTRNDGTEQIERLLRNQYSLGNVGSLLDAGGYRKLRRDRLIYASRAPEADNPYGTSILRGTEFVARVLATMDNALLQVWERFGNPSFVLTYRTKNRKNSDPEVLKARRDELAANLSASSW